MDEVDDILNNNEGIEEEEDLDDGMDDGSNTHESQEDDRDENEDENNGNESIVLKCDSNSINVSDIKIGGKSDPQCVYNKIHDYYTRLLLNAKLARSYSIIPSAAIPIQTHVQSIAMSKGLKYLFLGGEDGYIRKYDFLNTIQGRLSLTILQKHSLVESISHAGILCSYWENEVPQYKSALKISNTKEYEPVVSPVHSLQVHSECLFLLAGQESGGITMQGVRYMEGKIGYYFKKHTGPVNQLLLNDDETKFLSGSWDKQLLEWDLNTGSCINEFLDGSSQLSSLSYRPLFSSVEINQVIKEDEDDMNSLFGDDEHENESQKYEKSYETISNNVVNEISKSTLRTKYNENVFQASYINGSVQIWDRRISTKSSLSLFRNKSTPPWCMSSCWSLNGDKIYVGRRNAVVEEYDLRMNNQVSRSLRLPPISGPVSCVQAMPNSKHIICASVDNIRIFDITNPDTKTPFLIISGHHGGIISNLYLDPTCRFLVSTSGSKGWQGVSTDTTLIYEIDLDV